MRSTRRPIRDRAFSATILLVLTMAFFFSALLSRLEILTVTAVWMSSDWTSIMISWCFRMTDWGASERPVQQQTTLHAANAGVAVADFNGDGKLDFATLATDSNGYGVVKIVFNTTPTQSGTITVSGLAPNGAQEGSTSPVRLVGTGFPSGMKVAFAGPGPNLVPANLSISSDGTVATGTLSLANAMPGSYSLLLSNSVGTQLLSIPDAFTVNTPTALRFIPAIPCRVVDTRNAAGPFGGPYIAGGTSREFDIPSGPCGIPIDRASLCIECHCGAERGAWICDNLANG